MKQKGGEIWRYHRETLLAAHLGHPVPVDAGAVIGHCDLYLIIEHLSAHRYGPRCGLPGRDAYLRFLYSVIDRVDQKMTKRLPDQVDDLAVELNVLSTNHEAHVFASSSRQVPDKLREGRYGLEERDVGERHRTPLDVTDRLAQPLELCPPGLAEKLGVGTFDRDEREIGKRVGVERDFHDPVDELVEITGVDAGRPSEQRLRHGAEEPTERPGLRLANRNHLGFLMVVHE